MPAAISNRIVASCSPSIQKIGFSLSLSLTGFICVLCGILVVVIAMGLLSHRLGRGKGQNGCRLVNSRFAISQSLLHMAAIAKLSLYGSPNDLFSRTKTTTITAIAAAATAAPTTNNSYEMSSPEKSNVFGWVLFLLIYLFIFISFFFFCCCRIPLRFFPPLFFFFLFIF